MKFEIKSRWTGNVIYTAVIQADDDTSDAVKLGRAILHAIEAGADLRGANLSGAYLRDAYLRWVDLRGADMRGADMRGAALNGADMRGADMRGTDMRDTDMRDTDMRDADLGDAPVIEDIHTKVYAAASQPGALGVFAWHYGTTHCRAGWIVNLAGEDGAKLEAKIGMPAAAIAICMASDPERWKVERLPDFYATKELALADMKRMAEDVAA